VSDATATIDPPDSASSRRIVVLVIAHLIIAIMCL
jgi:hypothetical protein